MSTPGQAQDTFGRWPDDDEHRGRRRGGGEQALGGIRSAGQAWRRRGGVRRHREGGERQMVPEATFTSYYGRPILKPSPWKADIPAYIFLGGVAAGSSLLGAGGDLTGRPALRRVGRLGALVSISLSTAALVHDLGKPSRFINMLRVARPTSPMSMGSWILALYGPLSGLAGTAELSGLLPAALRGPAGLLGGLGRPAGIGAALVAPAVASYTGVLLGDTATPTWHDAHRHLPLLFAGSAAAASGGLGMLATSTAQAGPARRMALGGAVLDLAVGQHMESTMGLTAEPLRTGRGGTLMRAAKALNVAGAVGTLFAGRSRVAAVVSGAALLAGSVCTRFGVFEAGQESARDPKYTVVPQRERVDAREATSRT